MCGLFPCARRSATHGRLGLRRRTVYEHVPRRGGERGGEAVEIFREPHLAAEAGGVGEPERHVEHVVLVVLRADVVRWGDEKGDRMMR